jgi:hypothetical protein
LAAVSAASRTSTASPRGDKVSACDAGILFIFIRPRGGRYLPVYPPRLEALMTDNRIYQSIEEAPGEGFLRSSSRLKAR